LDSISANNRETELQHELVQREMQVKNERLRQQITTSNAEYTKILADFEEFKTRARTVLKSKQEVEHDDVTPLRQQVRCSNLLFIVVVTLIKYMNSLQTPMKGLKFCKRSTIRSRLYVESMSLKYKC
jgi:hypothetical protein